MGTRTKNFSVYVRAVKNLSQTYNGSRETYNPGLIQHSNLLVPFSWLLLPATPAQPFQHQPFQPTTTNYYYDYYPTIGYYYPSPFKNTYPYLTFLLPYLTFLPLITTTTLPLKFFFLPLLLPTTTTNLPPFKIPTPPL